MKRSLVLGLAVLALPACALEGGADSKDDRTDEAVAQSAAAVTVERSFDVDFSNCTEMASLTPVPIANIRSLVPAQYGIAAEGNGVGFVVVRVASCAGVKIDGADIGGGTVAQVGVNLVSPDGSGDLDNYTLYYDTTSAVFTARLRAFGFDSRWLPGIQYTDAGTSLAVSVPGRGYSVSGPVDPPTAPGIPFEADWWSAGPSSESKTATTLPSIQFSTAHMTIATQPRSELRQIIGAPTATFPIFDSYNHFAAAHMTVTRRITAGH